MKYIDEYRNSELISGLIQKINHSIQPGKFYRLMEFCGGHTHVLHRFGLLDILPQAVEMIHGPGCPVCILPTSTIDTAIQLSQISNVILCSYADMMRVPGTNQQSLMSSKAKGADIRMVYSINDALSIARANPSKEIIFFAIGFETTTPPTAFAILQAEKEQLNNFSIYCNHVLTPVAMNALLSSESSQGHKLDGIVGPAHVSIIIGSSAYQSVAQTYQKPIVIAGFEPLDMLHAIHMLITMINQNDYGVQNQYTRAVTNTGNQQSLAMIEETMTLRDTFEWRGLGDIAYSSLKIKHRFKIYDAEEKYPIKIHSARAHPSCDCGHILKGVKKPLDCKLFGKACTPSTPLGACMVSSEGACAAAYAYQPRRNHHAKITD